MSALPPRSVYTKVPYSLPRLSRLLWLVWGGVVTFGIGSVWGLLLMGSDLSSQRSYVGQLRPQSDPITVTLPQGAILDQVVATQDEEIRTGQTLATLNVPAMKRSIERLSKELLHDDLLKECLLSERLPDTSFFAEASKEIRDQLILAVQECDQFVRSKARIQIRLEKALVSLQEERALIARYIRVLTDNSDLELTPEKKQDDARQALALALLRNKLDKQMTDYELQAEKDTSALREQRLETVRDLTKSIKLKTELRHSIEAALEAPRVQAPKDGFIVHVRSVPHSDPLLEDTQFIEMRPEEGLGYQAYFDVSHEYLDGVKPGDQVRMRLLGDWKNAPTLIGEVRDLNATGGPSVRVDIALDESSIADLDDPRNGIALRYTGTASEMRVQKDHFNAFDALHTQVQNGVLARDEQWFIRRLAAKYLNLPDWGINL